MAIREAKDATGDGGSHVPRRKWPLPKDSEERQWIKEQVRKKIRAAQSGGTDGTMWYSDKAAHKQSSLLQIAEHVVDEMDVRKGLHMEGGALNAAQLPSRTVEASTLTAHPTTQEPLTMYDELRHRFDGRLKLASSATDLITSATSDIGDHHTSTPLHGDGLHERSQSGACERAVRKATSCWRRALQPFLSKLRRGGGKGEDSRLTHEDDGTVPTGACVFILYLDGRTWTSSRRELLKEELLLRSGARARDEATDTLLHEYDTSVKARDPPVRALLRSRSDATELIKAGCTMQMSSGSTGRTALSLLEAASELLRLLERRRISSARSRWAGDESASALSGTGGAQRSLFVSSRMHDVDLLGDDGNDGTSALTLSPLMDEFRVVAKKPKAKADADAEDCSKDVGVPTFTLEDMGRTLTISRKRVFVGRVKRHVAWSRRVERSREEKAAKNSATKERTLNDYKWMEWRPLPEGLPWPKEIKDAAIELVEPDDDGDAKLDGESTSRSVQEGDPQPTSHSSGSGTDCTA